MKACSGHECASEDVSEETDSPTSMTSFEEGTDSDTLACHSVIPPSSAESPESLMSLDEDNIACETVATATGATGDVGGWLCTAKGKQIVDSGILMEELVTGSIPTVDATGVETVSSDGVLGPEDVTDLEEMMGMASDQALESIPTLDFAVASIESVEAEESAMASEPEPSAFYSDEAPESEAAFESKEAFASFPLPDRATQSSVVTDHPLVSSVTPRPSATKDDGIVGVGQPVFPVMDTRPDPRSFIAVVEQYTD